MGNMGKLSVSVCARISCFEVVMVCYDGAGGAVCGELDSTANMLP